MQFSCVDPEERLSSSGHAGELHRADYLLEFQAQLCPMASLFLVDAQSTVPFAKKLLSKCTMKVAVSPYGKFCTVALV